MERTILATGRGVADPTGKLLQYVGVLHDITEVSNQRYLAEDRALFAEQMMGIVSHDMRNPLQVISMAAQRIEVENNPAKQLAMLGHIRKATFRATKLTNDLLDFTQARLGQGLAMTLLQIDLAQTIESSIVALRLVYPLREIKQVIAQNDECIADADRLTQLVGNLVSNAMAYGDSGSPVTVSTFSAKGHYTVSVHNSGTPIAPELLKSIFTPMTRGEGANRSLRSVGLGLFIVTEIAKAYGGTVSVASDSQSGTLFTFTVPICQADTA